MSKPYDRGPVVAPVTTSKAHEHFPERSANPLLLSMTGFGSGASENGDFAARVEIRSVNHRYGDVVVRLPKGYQAVEDKVRRIAGEAIKRGRAEIFVVIEEFGGRERTVKLDQGLLKGYQKAVTQAGEILRQSGTLRLDMLVNLPDVFVVEEESVDPDAAWPVIEEALDEALQRLVEMRTAEGTRLEADILERLAQVAAIVEKIAAHAPNIVTEYRERLTQRLSDLLGANPVDEERIAQEVALFADKSNIDEELTRARSHVDQFRDACASGEAVGRKLDFLLQEINREINTIGSKAQSAQVAGWVVEVKAELEKIREQVQNVQ